MTKHRFRHLIDDQSGTPPSSSQLELEGLGGRFAMQTSPVDILDEYGGRFVERQNIHSILCPNAETASPAQLARMNMYQLLQSSPQDTDEYSYRGTMAFIDSLQFRPDVARTFSRWAMELVRMLDLTHELHPNASTATSLQSDINALQSSGLSSEYLNYYTSQLIRAYLTGSYTPNQEATACFLIQSNSTGEPWPTEMNIYTESYLQDIGASKE